ncbi:dTDP-4-dehydrorhamnose 3,5-epimerase [Synechococcus elongatus]|uniref:dTDP-4-dehydrorhamnose 3,5-epimerase n=2 Tax=Synechococcus elongatus TaxID=32046 RepID=Q31S79_SYNE7|nr:dTDP-4-dehydrorhamnose 3,5-epimerase [Synechococcus elongatus]ABB56090.1 dTDP-4-dehydrorhamnose 3,5-epimerase [Synechococcus elongatus PCC 7942 = FACHB-805]AJD56849.1 dTDP-4-dehydrorhamnose 3,5-epimerase [Synechococcus elongatus UTEX 2973]MBD2587923.1 dTDP-4-dehydrorhamnose 3,5-epimerase [Synechococcus elongatus FACHB-242]MBD2688991.1 dTDP-4-dehydrorhamnose 3,5-epimerase [Synechococcus elongatus FACHB-1061]MBD2707369.1 dTDP-4-dehydrorhamnose 3,5-epimerase [Synechococcus elongatus PCC 7942 =
MPTELRATAIAGVLELISQPFQDHRGAFLNAFREQEPAFAEAWGDRRIAQVNLSRTDRVGAIRGLHLQAAPHSEAKLVRCLRGRVWDVAVDLRQDSATYGQWQAVELSPEQANALLIPEGCAHGFQVLEANSELLYLHSGTWVPEAETGIRWDDPQLAIAWPLPMSELSDRDRALPFLSGL